MNKVITDKQVMECKEGLYQILDLMEKLKYGIAPTIKNNHAIFRRIGGAEEGLSIIIDTLSSLTESSELDGLKNMLFELTEKPIEFTSDDIQEADLSNIPKPMRYSKIKHLLNMKAISKEDIRQAKLNNHWNDFVEEIISKAENTNLNKLVEVALSEEEN